MKKGGSVTQHIPAPNAPGALLGKKHTKQRQTMGAWNPTFTLRKSTGKYSSKARLDPDKRYHHYQILIIAVHLFIKLTCTVLLICGVHNGETSCWAQQLCSPGIDTNIITRKQQVFPYSMNRLCLTFLCLLSCFTWRISKISFGVGHTQFGEVFPHKYSFPSFSYQRAGGPLYADHTIASGLLLKQKKKNPIHMQSCRLVTSEG